MLHNFKEEEFFFYFIYSLSLKYLIISIFNNELKNELAVFSRHVGFEPTNLKLLI